MERIAVGFHGRPHWAKVQPQLRHRGIIMTSSQAFGSGSAYLRSVYPRWDDFFRLRAQLDPTNLFTNDWHDRVLCA